MGLPIFFRGKYYNLYYNNTEADTMNEEIINKIELLLSNKIEKDIPCCEDSTNDYDAYNNLDNMYAKNTIKYSDITIFDEYINREELAIKLDVDYNLLNSLYLKRACPSKGLACAILLSINMDYNESIKLLTKLGYTFNCSDYDRIIEYFMKNNINDINLLNEVLIHFGQMYLFSRKKLR